jgi:hypothetical protein
MNYFILFSLLCAATIHAADQPQYANYTVHVRELVKADYDSENDQNRAAIIFPENYPNALVVTSKILPISLPCAISRGHEWETATNIIKQHANVYGETVYVDEKNKEVIFYMRSHRKNPDTRNAE